MVGGRKILNGLDRNTIMTWDFLTRTVFDYRRNLLRSSGFNRFASSSSDKPVNSIIYLIDSIRVENVSLKVELVFVLVCSNLNLFFV